MEHTDDALGPRYIWKGIALLCGFFFFIGHTCGAWRTASDLARTTAPAPPDPAADRRAAALHALLRSEAALTREALHIEGRLSREALDRSLRAQATRTCGVGR